MVYFNALIVMRYYRKITFIVNENEFMEFVQDAKVVIGIIIENILQNYEVLG